MPTTKNLLIEDAKAFVGELYAKQISSKFVYHNIEHVQEVVDAAEELAGSYELGEQDLDTLRLAAWFHDTGYTQGYEDHEKVSCQHARRFLQQYEYPEEAIQEVLDLILATKMDRKPQNLLQEILCDADMSHLGSKTYWDRCGKVRQELNLTQQVLMSEKEWIDFELTFMATHEYYTDAAKERYEDRKQKHIRQLKKHRQRLYPGDAPPLPVEELTERVNGEPKKKKKKKKKKNLKELNLGRGVETMYRTTYRTHINLSSIADNKANIMLSINAIIISIVVSNLASKLDSNPYLIIPTTLLLAVCLASLVFAILSTRPKITEGRFSKDDIQQKKANLLFFGNFYRMELDDFHWGMMEMIKDSDFLYSSMTRDLYYLGVVLAKKYKYLRVCYNVFMYGMIVALMSFVFAYLPMMNTAASSG